MTITANGDLHTATPAAGGPVQSAPVTVTNLGSVATATIANGATLSGAVDLKNFRLCGMIFPATFVGTSIGFQVCDTAGGTYVDLYDAYGTLVAVTCAASKATILPLADFIGLRFVKIKTASTQTADVSIPILTA